MAVPAGNETEIYPGKGDTEPTLPPITYPIMEDQTQTDLYIEENIKILDQIRELVRRIIQVKDGKTVLALINSLGANPDPSIKINLNYVNPTWPTAKEKRGEIYGLLDNIRALETQYNIFVDYINRSKNLYDGVPIITNDGKMYVADVNGDYKPVYDNPELDPATNPGNTVDPITGLATGQTNLTTYTPNTVTEDSGINWLYVVVGLVLVGVAIGAYQVLKNK